MQPNDQDDFTAALLSPDVAIPAGIVDPEGRVAPKRFAVYRNNVTVSLIDALAATFARVQAMVGEDFFREMARQFVRSNPPNSPLIMTYGAAFPAFIAAFEPAQNIPFLADVARLDRAWLDAYHAADAAVLDAQKLTNIPEADLPDTCFVPHPAMRLIASVYPLVTLWEACRIGQAPQFAAQPEPEWALIVRPDLDVYVRAISASMGAFLAALRDGVTLGEAAEVALSQDAQFDFAAALGLVISCGAFSDVNLSEGGDDD